MLNELTHLSLGAWVLILVAGIIILRTVASFWWKLRKAEMEFAFKRELLEHGYPAADIERLTRRRKSRRRKVLGATATAPVLTEPAQPLPVEDFGSWYSQRFGKFPLLAHVWLWLLYGYLWIPLWYAVTRARSGAVACGEKPSTRILAICGGVALVFAGLFGGISLVVWTAHSSSDSQRRLQVGIGGFQVQVSDVERQQKQALRPTAPESAAVTAASATVLSSATMAAAPGGWPGGAFLLATSLHSSHGSIPGRR